VLLILLRWFFVRLFELASTELTLKKVVGTSSVFGGFPNIVSHSFAVSDSKNATMSSGLIIVPEKIQVSNSTNV
jgi:hypothetical protein